MYAVAPHLIELSSQVNNSMQLALLSHAGVVYAFAEREGYAECLDEIEDDFREAATIGASRLSPLLANTGNFEDFQWGVAGLAGFLGHDKFARLLGNLDYYEEEFHYVLLDHTIPVEP
ncbi:hypothetical protein Mal64_03330 [Pseudobythopirellula maris]|uniref:Uncharacterized protein n=2 Tax=Pseudobythopirellula maris TaxID=2527991 RepID=A0A5C5ZT33_9BACT|nr:hypothetical protein Mal64_03330 [Pseudobythopirellula maris]